MVNNNNEAAQQASARTDKLIQEFQEHLEEFTNNHPEHADKQREIFEAWAIQKIAGLQLCVEHLTEKLNLQIKM